jgi:hypothetical protein
MQKRITNAYYPHFSVADDSMRRGDRAVRVSNEKVDHGTYDMNEEEASERHDNSNGTSSDHSSIGLNGATPTSSNNTPSNIYKDVDGSNSHTKAMSSEPRSEEEASIGSIAFSENQSGEVSWSESEGSTYISEDSESALAVRPVRKVKVVTIKVPEAEEDEVPAAYLDADIERKRKELTKPAERKVSDLVQVDLGNDQAQETENETQRQDLSSAQRPTKPSSLKKPRYKGETSATEKPNESLPVRPPKAKKVTLADEATAMLEKLGRDVSPEKKTNEDPRNFPLSYSPSPPYKRDDNRIYLEHVDYYSDIDAASTNDGLSEGGFISKDATSAIFCRRLIPLVIPVRKPAADEMSAVSSVNESSVMLSVMGGDGNSERAIHTHRSVPRKEEIKSSGDHAKRDPMRLSNVDYLSKVDIASENEDMSTVGYTIPYNVAHAAFDQRKAVPKEIPLYDGQGDVPLQGAAKRPFFIHVPSSFRQDSFSSLDSVSLTDESFGNDENFGDAGSDDAVRPAREGEQRAQPKESKNDKKDVANEKFTHPARTSKGAKISATKAKQMKSTTTDQKAKDSNKKRTNRAVPVHAAKDSNKKTTKSALQVHEAKDLNQKTTKSALPVHAEKGLNKKTAKSALPLHAEKVEDDSSTDLRIQALKKKIIRMQKSAEVMIAATSPQLESEVKKTVKPDEVENKKNMRNSETKKKSSVDSLKHKEIDSQKNSERLPEASSKQERPYHAKKRSDDLKGKLKLYDVDYLANVETASSDNDLSTVEIRMSKATASEAFSDGPIPAEVPVDIMDDVSAFQCEEEDVENGLRKQYARVPTGHPDYKKSSSQILLNKTKREAIYYFRKAKEQTFTVAGKFKHGAVSASHKMQQNPRAQKIQAVFMALWTKYMEGRTMTEQMIVGVVGLSFFVLVILLIVVIAKK